MHVDEKPEKDTDRQTVGERQTETETKIQKRIKANKKINKEWKLQDWCGGRGETEIYNNENKKTVCLENEPGEGKKTGGEKKGCEYKTE